MVQTLDVGTALAVVAVDSESRLLMICGDSNRLLQEFFQLSLRIITAGSIHKYWYGQRRPHQGPGVYNQRSLVECEGEQQENFIAAGVANRPKENRWVTEHPPPLL